MAKQKLTPYKPCDLKPPANLYPDSQPWVFRFFRFSASGKPHISFVCLMGSGAIFYSRVTALNFWRTSEAKRVQYSAARLLTATSRYEHVTPVLRSLHWLPVSARIDFKILLLVFKVLNGLGPLYLSELLRPHIPDRNLRSSKKKLLIVPKCNLKTYGRRAFSHRAPTLWNALPDDIRQVELLETFKSKLKTHLFRQFFHCFLTSF